MTAATRVMVLIDADNVSAGVVEQALAAVVERHGAAHVRRAYCTAEAALKLVATGGGEVVGCAFVIDLPELGGRARLERQGHAIVALCAFGGH